MVESVLNFLAKLARKFDGDQEIPVMSRHNQACLDTGDIAIFVDDKHTAELCGDILITKLAKQACTFVESTV